MYRWRILRNETLNFHPRLYCVERIVEGRNIFLSKETYLDERYFVFSSSKSGAIQFAESDFRSFEMKRRSATRRSAFARSNMDRLFPMLLFHRSSILGLFRFLSNYRAMRRASLYCIAVKYARGRNARNTVSETLSGFRPAIMRSSLWNVSKWHMSQFRFTLISSLTMHEKGRNDIRSLKS